MHAGSIEQLLWYPRGLADSIFARGRCSAGVGTTGARATRRSGTVATCLDELRSALLGDRQQFGIDANARRD